MEKFTIIFLALCFASCKKSNPGEKSIEINPPQPPIETNHLGYNLNYQFLGNNPVQDKNFYLFTLIQEDNNLNALFKNDIEFKKYNEYYKNKIKNCVGKNLSNEQILDSLRYDDQYLSLISSKIEQLYADSALNQYIKNHIRPCGYYENYRPFSDLILLKRAFVDAFFGINAIMEVYLGVKEADYPIIDGPIYNTNETAYKEKVQTALKEVAEKISEGSVFFEPSLNFALQLLQINGRNEPARFYPLKAGHNKAALAKVASIKWSDYPYSVVVVLGDSPNSPGDDPKLSEGAKARIPLAVERYKSKLAPFIMFTGSNVNPKGSPWHEAIQMKAFLLENYPEIPESAIIVDPYARHTTTNLRNASRLIIRYGIPSDKKVLITSSPSQINYMMEGNTFSQRNQKELGFQPMNSLVRYSANDIEAVPATVSLHHSSIDPLDP